MALMFMHTCRFWNVRLIPRSRQLVGRRTGDVFAIEHDFAIARCVDTGNQVEQRRLACSIGADDRMDGLAPDRECDVLDGLDSAEGLESR